MGHAVTIHWRLRRPCRSVTQVRITMAIRSNPTIDASASLDESFVQLDDYLHLGLNWDGEDALPIERKVVSRAKNLLRLIAASAGLLGLMWESPSLAPNPSWAVELTWEKGNRWVMLVVEPGHSRIGCAVQEDDAEPRYRPVSRDDAIEQVLWAMRG